MGVKFTDKDHGWKNFTEQARLLVEARGMRVKVGVLDDAKGEEKPPGSDLTVAEIAAVNEFGTEDGHVPERSFLRSTFEEERDAMEAMGRQLLGAVMDGKMTPEVALGRMGAQLASRVRDKIRSNLPPPNAPSTMLKKAKTGRTAKHFKRAPKTLGAGLAQVGALAAVKTLIDTGRLLGAITWALVKRGER